ncbi:FAD synthase [Penaeus vannamei]|uniref:FAD synthase n=1 Tax=Penaeus vannamei TaxID=6689 RepID=A0A3R7QJQ1_PENVA|nr:FAD synthase [Penaeus vannamei]
MFPGIPAYLERDFHYLEKLFYSPDTKFHVKNIFLSEDENNLTGKLNDLVSHSPAVTVGSYPEVNNRYYRTRVSLQSESESELLEAEEYLRSSFSDEVSCAFSS